MKNHKIHAHFTSPISGIVVVLTLLAFVDDTEIFISSLPGETDQVLIVRAEIAINLWRELLYVTSGIMRSSKCAWTLMSPNNDWNRPSLCKQASNPGEIYIPDEDGTINKVPRYDTNEPREYLGVTQTTDGDEAEQLQVMENKIIDWNEKISASKLPPAINLLAVMSRIHRSLIYPLPALTIAKEQLQKLSNKLYWTSFPKCGIARTFPISYRHLPYKYQGLQMPSLYLEQEIGKLMEIIAFGYTDLVVWKQM